jgi:hypothetical protein
MRRALFALVLCHAVAASAQITVSDEVVSDPLRIRLAPLTVAAPAVSVAQDRAGIAVAWAMANSSASDAVDRVYVARLGANGQAGAVREMPLSAPSATTHAAYPALAAAPDGSGFVLAWLEVDPFLPVRARAVYCRLDAALAPSTPTVLFPAVAPTSPPLVRTKGGTTWIAVVGGLWTLSKDGALSGPLGSIAASDMTIGTDVPQLVGGHTVKSTSYTCKAGCAIGGGPFNGFCPDTCRIPGENSYALDFLSLFTTTASTTFNFATDAQPAIASDGRDVLLAWFSGTQTSGAHVVIARLNTGDFLHFNEVATHPTELADLPPDFGETRPAIASDGDRYVVVWREARTPGNHDVVGVIVDSDGKVTPLSIATSAADERDPAILSLGGGTFLVAYEKSSGIERRIAGRFVSFGRHRAAR